MSVTGRDVNYEEYPIIFNGDCCKWQRQGDNYDLAMLQLDEQEKFLEYYTGNIRKTLLRLLDEAGGAWRGRCSAVIDKSREYGTPIDLTSQKFGKLLANVWQNISQA